MKLRALRLRPFRNFDDQGWTFEADRTLIFGANGCGKTNILEAISYLSIGKSIRGARDHQAIPHGGCVFDICATCTQGASTHEIRVFFGRVEGKSAFFNRERLPRLSQLLGIFTSVHFAPQDVSLVLRFPAQRRRLLDILNAQHSPEYLQSIQRYQRILSQRNTILRSPDTSPLRDLQVWTEQLAEVGGGIRRMRLETLVRIRERFSYYMKYLNSADEEVSISYRGASVHDASQARTLLNQLLDKQEQERSVGYTLAGPHRDDLVFKLNDRAADSYASEGQMKSILISWKMAEVSYLAEGSGDEPVLLLDDVFSELDERRTQALVEIVQDFQQVIITTPRVVMGKYTDGFHEIILR